MMADPADELSAGFQTVTGVLSAASRAPTANGASVSSPEQDDSAIPVTLLTGFLGSGKTTVLRRLLSADHGLRITAIVNDLAAVNIDADLLDGDTGPLDQQRLRTDLSNGCACCQLSDELLDGLHRAAEAAAPDAIVIEPSGGSDTLAMAAAIEAEPGFHLDGIVCLVDAAAWVEHLAHPTMKPLIVRQLQTAHLVMLTKTDLVDSDRARAVTEAIAELAPGRRVLPVTDGAVSPSLVLGAAVAGAALRPSHQDHTIGLNTRSVAVDDRLDLKQLGNWLEQADHNLLRSKGWVFGDDGRCYELQVVGRRWTLRRSTGNHQPIVVMISDDASSLDRAEDALFKLRC